MTHSETNNRRRWLSSVAWILGAVVVTVIVLWYSPTAREVVGEASLTIFQIVTAPFVLETSLAVLGLCIVMAINHYRQQREGDGWVYLQKQEPSSDVSKDIEDPPHRHDAVVWQEKPECFDEGAAKLEVIEGYLDLGLADDALRELAMLSEDLTRSEQADELRIRALAMVGRLSEASRAIDELAVTYPERVERLASAALLVAIWLHEQGKAGPEINEWLERSRHLDPQAFEALPSGHVLRAQADK